MSPGVLVVLLATAANAAYLPPGAVLRFGDDRWRAGGRVDALVFSPNGKMFATTERAGGVVSLKVWDADTGRPTREARLNDDLFCGFAWGNNGGFAVVRRVDRDARGRGTLVPDDFVVWDFTDPYAFPPPLFDRIHYCTSGPQADIVRPQTRERFIGFAVAASGNRIVAFRELRGKEFPTVEVYELTATSSATRLTRASLPADVQVVSQGWLSANGRVLVTYSDGDSDSETRTALWPLDLSSGKEWRFIQIPGRAKEVAISADGSTLAAANHKRCDVITLIDLKTGKKRADLPYPKPLYRGDSDHDLLAFSPDAGRLLITVSRGAAVLDVATGKERGRLEGHAAELSAFAFSPDGKRIATADENGLIRLWDAVTLRPLNEPTGHRAEVRFARLSPDGKRLLTWAKDETARVWDMTTGKELRAFGSVCAPTFTPDWLAVVVSTRERLMIRDVVTGSEVPLPEGMSKHPAAGAVFAPDGKALLTYPASGESLTVWDWPSGSRRLAVIKPPGNDQYDPEPIRDPGFSSDSALVFSAIDNPNRWDARTGKHRTIAWDEERGRRLCVGLYPQARGLVEEAHNGPVAVLDGGTGRKLSEIRLPAGWWEVALAPNGRAAASEGGVLGPQLIETASGGIRRTLGTEQRSTVLGFTPDGTRLLTAGADHTVLVWDVRLQAVPLPPEVRRETDAAKLWATMTAGRADAAYLAMARLAAEPAAAVATARKRMRPAVAPDDATLERLLRQLGDDEFAVREGAEKELDGYGEPAAELVKRRLTQIESPEARRRADGFVKRWCGDTAIATRLADMRAIELLEALGTPEAKAFLKELAVGEASAWRTKEAKRAASGVGGK